MQFLKVGKYSLYQIGGVRTVGMAGKLDFLPGAKVGIDLALGQIDLLLNGPDLIGKVQIGIGRGLDEIIELFLQFKERLFKIQALFVFRRHC